MENIKKSLAFLVVWFGSGISMEAFQNENITLGILSSVIAAALYFLLNK